MSKPGGLYHDGGYTNSGLTKPKPIQSGFTATMIVNFLHQTQALILS